VLRTVSFEIGSQSPLAVTPYVDGASLDALVEGYERAKGYDPAGGYGGLIAAYFNYGPLDEYFTGENKSDYWMSLKGIYLLGCSCGEVGCWPLIASVHQKADTIRWDGFVQPHRRERDYSEFGPFTFSRGQYEDAVKDLLFRLNSAGANSPT
jgi:hypothetical protein